MKLPIRGQFLFKKETCSSKGLRSPQIGALHALLAHVEDGNESAIIVMPTGTGKTETMLAFLVANVCKKVFVIVPSDALRSQTCRKFKKLGLLKDLGVVPYDIKMPIVSMIKNALDDLEWNAFIKVFPPKNVVMFTATPFRNDGQKLSGKVIFNFSLRKAQEQGYYQKINNYQITKYSEEEADKAIAAKAVSVLESDLAQGFDDIIMAR